MKVKNANKTLQKAKNTKDDEFYTQYKDIQVGIERHKEQVAGKTVYCNCDNPRYSNFWKYFHEHFAELGLKGLIATYLDFENAEKWVYTGGNDDDTSEAIIEQLFFNGSYDSPECEDILTEECNVVITNPPFSLSRHYIKYLLEHEKEFYVLSPHITIFSKDLIGYAVNNKVWIEKPLESANIKFLVPKRKEDGTIDFENTIITNVNSTAWFTNLDSEYRHILFDSGCKFEDNKYEYFDGLNIIEVPTLDLLPMDYKGLMGVPVTYLYNYNPEQYAIKGCLTSHTGKYKLGLPVIKGKTLFSRLVIQKIGN